MGLLGLNLEEGEEEWTVALDLCLWRHQLEEVQCLEGLVCGELSQWGLVVVSKWLSK